MVSLRSIFDDEVRNTEVFVCKQDKEYIFPQLRKDKVHPTKFQISHVLWIGWILYEIFVKFTGLEFHLMTKYHCIKNIGIVKIGNAYYLLGNMHSYS